MTFEEFPTAVLTIIIVLLLINITGVGGWRHTNSRQDREETREGSDS
jgi:hypothetical protein